jgi:hypothetical protein
LERGFEEADILPAPVTRSRPPSFVVPLLATTLACGAACSAPVPGTAPVQPARPPNIVFVLVDDMRWDEVRAAGHPFIETPNMDRLAREGARFLNAFATTPLCSPSRASLLTGQYAHTHGIVDNTARASHQLPTFPRALAQAGYRTGFFGKWHMGNDDTPRPGFTRWVAMPGQGEALDPHLNVDGDRIRVQGYATDVLTDYVERFIQDSGNSPFLVYLAHKAIHPNVVQLDDGRVVPVAGQPGGFVAAERHRGRYAGRRMPRRANAFKPPLDKPALLRRIDDLPPLGPETATKGTQPRWNIVGPTNLRSNEIRAAAAPGRNRRQVKVLRCSKGFLRVLCSLRLLPSGKGHNRSLKKMTFCGVQ